MNGHFRNLIGSFTTIARFAPPDTRSEKLFRLILSGAVIVLGLYSLNQGYERAYSGDGSFFRPDGNGDHYFVDIVGVLAWITCLLGNRLRIWAWAFVIFLTWWCYRTTSYYLGDHYYVMGREGCLPCLDRIGELHLGIGAFGVCAFVFAIILGFKQTTLWHFLAGAVLASAWFFMLGGLG